ncbi:ABC transporter permease [Microbacterium sp. NPDC076911]|uniref:ABC transporter permease n=1 Tax=Microbacterium sp. NPDC076911 TaxID=3154958 RepID=UPI00341FB290
MSVLALGASRVGYEIRGYFRAPDTLLFTFFFPVMMLALFSSIFGADGDLVVGPDVEALSAAQLYLPGMLAAGLLLSGFQNLATDIAMERSDGTLKRLGGTPLSPLSYFLGKFGQVFATGIVQATLLLLVAAFGFGVELPTSIESWTTFAWVFVLGILTSALLGIAMSAVPRTGKSAVAVVVPVALILQFTSGVYLFFWLLPDWLQNLASLFPLVWMARGMRAVFLPEDFATLEPAGAWELGWVAVALLIWLVVGAVLSLLTFRWNRRSG